MADTGTPPGPQSPQGSGTGGPRPAGTRQGGQQQRRLLGLPVPVVIAVGAGVVALGVIWWRDRAKSSGAATSSATRTSSTSSTDLSGQLEELQAEVDMLMGQANAAGSGTGTGGGTTTTTKTTATAKTTKTTTAAKPGPVTDLTVVSKTPTSVTVSWRPPQFASHAPTNTTYTIQVKPKDTAAHNIGSRTSYNVGGLKKDTHYTVSVAASGGPATSKSFTTEK